MSFSTGFVFWYWPYYAPNNNDQTKQKEDNRNDFGGYSVSDLYIKQGKYDNFKDEILEYSDGKNGDITMEIYKNKILLKAQEFMETKRVKNIKAKQTDPLAMRYYDIASGAVLPSSHIMGLILYCDFTGLCTSFSSTFRRLYPLESLKGVKQRNKMYWWMSKILRETVEIYGDDRWDEPGPFYCGMSFLMVMPSFSIRLNGPTSTTKQIEISMNFAKNEGIIIQLNNEHTAGGYYQRFFNVSWLSAFKEEDERMTFGGSFQLQIQSIRNTNTLQNFDIFFKPLKLVPDNRASNQNNGLKNISKF